MGRCHNEVTEVSDGERMFYCKVVKWQRCEGNWSELLRAGVSNWEKVIK